VSLTDGEARRAVRERLDETWFVEAGAGTGKTTALVARICELVLSGRARLGEVAAITFTEAAAAELRDRLADELERQAADGEADDDRGVPGRTRAERGQRAAEALTEIDGAAIGTLHAFARRVLAEHPFEAGLPPVFEVFDEVRSSVAFGERWAGFVDALLDDTDLAPSLRRCLACGIGLDHLEEIARQLNASWDLVADHPPRPLPLGPVDPGPLERSLAEALALDGCCTETADKLLTHLEKVAVLAARVAGATSEYELLSALSDVGRLDARLGRKDAWSGRIDEVRGHLETAERARRELLLGAARAGLANLLAALGGLTLAAADERRREGRLEYHDLLVQARELLRWRPDVAAALGARYRYQFIDEFQDTDPIQAELAVRIASPSPSAGDRPWQELEVAPGRLFFVGDGQQSIYRFRRADVQLFVAMRDRFGREPLRLSHNHRSVPGVLDFVNAVFGELIGEGVPGSQPAYDPLTPTRPAGPPEGPTAPPVVLLGGPAAAGTPLETLRTTEAADVAAAITRARGEGWPVGDDRRPTRLADVAVLVPSRTTLPYLQEALDAAGLPYRLETSSLVYASREVVDLLTVLRAVDDPTDEVAVVAALRSTMFGCGDDDLFDFVERGGRWDYRVRPPSGAVHHPVAVAQRALDALHRERWWCEVSSLLERILAERRLLALSLDEPRPREAWRRLRYVVDQARRYADAFGGDVRGFLAWAEVQAAEESRVAEPVVPEGDHDAVRIMTVHAAKGLEFPVVVLSGLNVRPNPAGNARVLFGEAGAEVKVGATVETSGWERLAAAEEELEGHERLRLLYVAATRAMDHLVVSVHHADGERRPSLAAALAEAAASCPTAWRRLDAPTLPPPPPAPPTRDGGPVEPDGPEERQSWAVAREALLARAARPRTLAATAVVRLAEEEAPGQLALFEAGSVPPPVEPSDDRPAWRRGRAGTAVGRAVHAVLQSVDLATGEGLAELAAAQAAAEGVPGRVAEVEQLAQAALDAGPVRAAVAAGRYFRELYVGVPVGERVLEGFCDLVVDGPDGLVVVDYKTDQVGDEELTAVLDRYRAQGGAYALALEEALGRPVVRCTFLFLRPGGAEERDLEDLPEAKAQVKALLTRR